jgi:hypothetical protein
VGLELIYKADLRKCQVQILNNGGVILQRPFNEPIFIAPYAPSNERESLLDQVPEVDQKEVRRICQQIQNRLTYLIGKI